MPVGRDTRPDTHPETDTLSVTDNRTGKQYEIPVSDGAIPATAFAKVMMDGEGVRVFDPGYQNTAVVRSKICYIDGERGVLEYRGYGIEELAEKSTFLEVAYLLIYGELPNKVCVRVWACPDDAADASRGVE